MSESNQTEAWLRDELSKRLDLLEPGLTLRSVEFRLPNRQGASGSIDILASDSYSATVIIELKKSNQTARQALHEIHKYVALLKDAHGLQESQIRCVLASTEWHELLMPFSEFARTAPWAIDGYRLFLTNTGVLDRAEKVIPVAPSAELRLCPEHSAYLFREQTRRDEAVPVLLKLLNDGNIREYLLLKLDIKRRRFEGTCDFALYLIIPEFAPDERRNARDRLARTRWADDLDGEVQYIEEQLVVMEATGSFGRDEFEIGYPEKLAGLCVTWDVTALIRGGPRLEPKAVFSDEYLLRWAKGLEGRNALCFEMIATPSRELSWREAKENAEYCLSGNEAWRDLVRAYLDEIERNHPDATVTARIYNPCNLMMGLYRLAKLNVGDSLPSAEIVVSNKERSPARTVLGSLVWNGKRVNGVAEVLPEGIPTLFDLFFAAALDGGTWAAEEHLIAQHGLSYVLVECTESLDGIISEQLVMEGDALRRLRENTLGLQDFGAFYAAHQDYLQTLVKDFDSWSYRID
jgi:Endonuclease NucS